MTLPSKAMRSSRTLPLTPSQSSPPTMAWTCPSHIRTELKLFTGQLYFDSKEEYDSMCVLFVLNMAYPDAKELKVDGFVRASYRIRKSLPLSVSAIATFKGLMNL